MIRLAKILRYRIYAAKARNYLFFRMIQSMGLLDLLSKWVYRKKETTQLALDRYKCLKGLPFEPKTYEGRYIIDQFGDFYDLRSQVKGARSFTIDPVYQGSTHKDISIEAKRTAATVVAGHNAHPDGPFVKEGSTELSVFSADKVTIHGNFQTFQGDRILIFDPFYDPKDHASGHRYLPTSREAISTLNSLMYMTTNVKPQQLMEGLLLCSKACQNYFHFMFEDLSRLLQYEPYLKDRSLPVYVANDMPTQHYEALVSLLGHDRLIQIDRNVPYTMDKIHYAQIPMNLSDNIDTPGKDRFHACPEHVLYMRNRILDAHKDGISKSPKKFPKKIFLARKNRSVINSQALYTVLRHHGIKPIDTSKLSFKDQVQLFSQAELVIGAAGAALSNIIFCKPGTRIIVLNSDRHSDNCGFSTLAHLCDLDYKMIVGPPRFKKGGIIDYAVGRMGSYLSSFKINASELEDLLKGV